MNREKAKQLLPLIEAFADGKTIQVKGAKGEWISVDTPEFSFDANEYRIKPEPREWLVVIGNDGLVRDAELCFESSRKYAIRVREILD